MLPGKLQVSGGRRHPAGNKYKEIRKNGGEPVARRRLISGGIQMGFCTKNGETDQSAWIKAYMDLTGVTESEARSVFMYVGCKDTVSTEDECAPKKHPAMVTPDFHVDENENHAPG